MSSKQIAVIGATGNVGSKLVKRLLDEGHSVRAVARGGARLEALAAQGAHPIPAQVTDVGALASAFRGADAAFVMVPPDYAAPDMAASQRATIDAEITALREARVPRVVALSSVGAHHASGTGPIAQLHLLEERLRALAGADVLALRAAYFMENHLGSIGLIRAAGINGSPLRPDVAMPTVATKDIADVAARELAHGSFTGFNHAYVLGPRDLTMVEVTSILGASIGKPDLAYVPFTFEDTKRALVGAGFSPSVADAFNDMYLGINEGRVAPSAPRSAASTTPTSLEQWSEEVFAKAFAG